MKRYTFKYSPEPSRRGIIYRPVAYVDVRSLDGDWFRFYPYVDSGADTSLFSRGDATLLKLRLLEGEPSPIMGIGRVLMLAYLHSVKMRIGDVVFDVKAAFADSDEVPRLLGREDVFKRFRVTFDEADLQTVFEPRE